MGDEIGKLRSGGEGGKEEAPPHARKSKERVKM